MTSSNNEEIVDISEKGRLKDGTVISSDRRLFMQLLVFGGCSGSQDILISSLRQFGLKGVLYSDLNDPYGVGLLITSEDPSYFVEDLREYLNHSPFKDLDIKQEYTMFGRTYSFGYESDLEKTLVSGPKDKVLNEDYAWAVWYPLRRSKNFETLSKEDQRSILGEHGKVGFKFGKAGYATDIRLACYGLDKRDNDFVIAVLSRELYSISAVVQAMRKTKQTSMYIESMGPFFVGRALWKAEPGS